MQHHRLVQDPKFRDQASVPLADRISIPVMSLGQIMKQPDVTGLLDPVNVVEEAELDK